MTNRHDYHKRPKQREGRFVRVMEYMMASAAWQALDGNCKALYIELSRRYRGPNSNNGKIPYSCREAAGELHIGRSTAQRCFDRLQELGFIKVCKRSGFNMKGRASTEWLLTEFPDDTRGVTAPASKEFMSWTSVKSFHSPTVDKSGPISEPPMALRRDRVA
jgi:hypothetical protein